MRTYTLLPAFLLFLTACSHTYYVVRHAEKEPFDPNNMTSGDVPLTEAGQKRSQALKDSLVSKKIALVYSTNTMRTVSTAKPTAEYFNLLIQYYGPSPDSAFLSKMRKLKSNTLIVGHSNTVDNIVNGLTGTQSVAGDLADSEYDNLFVVKYKRFFSRKISYTRKKYGAN